MRAAAAARIADRLCREQRRLDASTVLMSGFGAPARTERPKPASTNGVTVLATTLPFLTNGSSVSGLAVTRSAAPLLMRCSSASPST